MNIGDKIVNVAVQVLPVSATKDTYAIVDEAIKVIAESGMRYVVTPFETVLEGEYDKIMEVVKRVQEVCYESETQNMMCYIKIQSSTVKEVTIDDKIGKYK